jgi:hypothetical protein
MAEDSCFSYQEARVQMTLERIPEIVDGLPNIGGWEDEVRAVTPNKEPVFLPRIAIDLERLHATFAIALHMHQPLILDGGDLMTARMIGNLQYMMENQQVHGNHDAPAFAECYGRMADCVRELVDRGRHPRVMLDYSGCLLFGLRQMGRGDILDKLTTSDTGLTSNGSARCGGTPSCRRRRFPTSSSTFARGSSTSLRSSGGLRSRAFAGSRRRRCISQIIRTSVSIS